MKQTTKQKCISQKNLERITCKNLIWHIIIITIIMFIALYNIPKPKVSESYESYKTYEFYNDKTTTPYVSNLVMFEPQIEEELSEVEVDYYYEFAYSKDWPAFEEFEATAYCACPKCCGKWADGITASGTKATVKRTIAVDSNLIPLGSKVEIEGLGTYIAEDTGNAIKGKIIDIYFDTHEEALKFGRQKVNIRILSSANGGN
jgi:3D (Asp-Asp-Asp) domain-containing protein